MILKKTKKILLITLIIIVSLALILFGLFKYVIAQFEKALVCRDTVAYWRDDAAVQILRDQDDTFLEMGEDGYNKTVEFKIYYYRFIDPILYVINKWGRYTVVNTETLEVIDQTENFNALSQDEKAIFKDIDSFQYIGYRDEDPKRDAIEFGDGTIYLEVGDHMSLFCEKQLCDGSNILHTLTNEYILSYKQDSDKLYLIGEEGSYMVVDLKTYKIVSSEKDIENLSDTDKNEFEDKEDFIDREEALELIS